MRLIPTLLAVFCVIVPAHAAPNRALPRCAAIAGSERLWSIPGLRFVVVGEMHGTAESQAIFADLVCSARRAKRPIVVGLERNLAEQDAIDAFLAPNNHKAAIHSLLSEQGWNVRDGRSSRAMLTLLEQLRALKLRGVVSGVVAFSVAFDGSESPSRGEERMASALLAAANRYPDALVIALVGNVHACKKTPAELGVSYPLMASFLPSAETVSLLVTDRGGEAWNCQGGACGPHKLGSSGGVRREIALSQSASPLPGYDGALSTGRKATASFPATGNPPPGPAPAK